MTIIAGAWSPGRRTIPAGLRSALTASLSRHEPDRAWVHDAPGCMLAKVDIGAFGDPAAEVGPDASALIIAGEPLVDRGDGVAWRPRSGDAKYIHERLLAGDPSVLAQAQGAYCLAQYDARAHVLRLATDQLGVRPLYEARAGNVVVFASALRILERIGLELHLDVLGTVEQSILQAPLEGRTVYREVRLLGHAELVEHAEGGRSVSAACRWDAIAEAVTDESTAVEAIDSAFTRAVSRRRRDDRATTSLLSGGLDSRTIVTALRSAGMAVRTLNLSLVGSLDHALGARFAEAAGTFHESHPYVAGIDDSYEDMTARLLAAPPPPAMPRPERPGLVWVGNGGSAIVGQVNIRPAEVTLCRQGRTGDAVSSYFAYKGGEIPLRMFRPPHASRLRGATHRSVRGIFESWSPPDPGRRMALYLILHPTRSQMHPHHEETDLRRIEQQMPFLDPEVVRTSLSIPYDLLSGHRLYHRWLARLGHPANTVAWQAYPGHQPCPLPLPAGARPQWDLAAERGFQRRALVALALARVRDPRPRDVLDRRYLLAIAALQSVTARNYGYAIRLADALHGWWARSGARPVPLYDPGGRQA